MKPLIVLIASFFVTLLVTRLVNGHADIILAGNIAMATMLLFTAIGHFVYTKGMAMMIPGIIPFKTFLVYVTGLIEILAAAGLLLPQERLRTSSLLIVFFMLLLPANIYAAANKVDYQSGTKEGAGINYLWFRVPLQLFFIWWVWYFGAN